MVLSVSFHFFKWLPAGIGPVADRLLCSKEFRKADNLVSRSHPNSITMNCWVSRHFACPNLLKISQFYAVPKKTLRTEHLVLPAWQQNNNVELTHFHGCAKQHYHKGLAPAVPQFR